MRAVPIFDPATIRLRGYLFFGLALGQNRSLMEQLVTGADVDGLAIDDGTSLTKRYQDRAFAPEGEVNIASSEPIQHDGFYMRRSSVSIDGLNQPLWLTIALDEARFTSLYDDYWRIFLLLSGGFLALLIAAAWLINWSNNRAINNLTRFISAIQQGHKYERYQPGGVYEYNQVGLAMERMVEDLNVAATVFESANGMIVALGNQVLTRACQEVAAWSSDPRRSELTLAVNISARQLRQPEFADQVSRIIQESGFDPTRLKLEITESMLMEDIQDSVEKMRRLKLLGVRFALDDFGNGYSSLSYLKRLPLDELKIDKSFVRDLLSDPYDADIARTIVSLALSLNIDVIAEGVETREQRDRLAEFGCYAYQGYFYGKPVPFEELAA